MMVMWKRPVLSMPHVLISIWLMNRMNSGYLNALYDLLILLPDVAIITFAVISNVNK